MKKKYVIYSLTKRSFFEGSDLEGTYFGNDNPRYFDTKEEAEKRIIEECEYMQRPMYSAGTLTIIEVFTYSS